MNFFLGEQCIYISSFNKKKNNLDKKLNVFKTDSEVFIIDEKIIDFNKKDTIGSELDIYFPSLNLAIELNGIFHYEPIYGVDKLNKVQENDKSKTKICHDLKIDLCIIDVSQQKYVKPSTSQKYLDIITNIINERLLISSPALPVSNNHPVEVD